MLYFSSKVLLLIVICFVKGRISLWCFQCSVWDKDIVSNKEECPDLGNGDPLDWKEHLQKYGEIKLNDEKIVCVVGYSERNGQVYYQAGVVETKCDIVFKKHIETKIQAEEPKVVCCEKDGCNWNATTAKSNLALEEFANATDSGPRTVGPGGMDRTPYIIIGVVATALIFCCFCFCCIRSANKSKNKEQKDKEILDKMYNNPGDVATNQPSRGGRNNRIQVREAYTPPPFGNSLNVIDLRDHERYSAIDKRIHKRRYRRDNSKPYSAGDVSNFNSNRNSPYHRSEFSVEDPYDEHNKHRIGAVSKHLFDNADFRTVNKKFKDQEERRNKRDINKRPQWKDPPNKGASVPMRNPFRFNSA